MNDHVGKPFDIEDLCSRIVRVLGGNKAVNKVDEKEPSCVGEVLNIDNALQRMGGQKSVYERAVQRFMKSTSELHTELNQWVSDKNWASLRDALHSLRGVASTVGADQLAQRCFLVEEVLQGGAELNKEHWGSLLECLKQTRRNIETDWLSKK
jgi:HPt (histidine-containing phosphotransfer) domain-containing protein